MLSIANGDMLSDEVMDNSGTEFQISTLLGSDSDIYFSLINHHYKRTLNDEEIKNVINFHIEKGLKNEGLIEKNIVKQSIMKYKLDPEKPNPIKI